MTCATCGRENPPHLTFCQECGQRLGPRIAPPTPPIGLGGDYGMPDVTPAPPPQNLYNQPPSRLATSLGSGPSPVAAQGQAQAHAQVQAAQAQQGSERRCRICATVNGPNLRYCTSCGSTLEGGASQQPAPAGTHVAAPAPAPAGHGQPRLVEAAPVAPAPVYAAPIAPAPAPFAATALDQNPYGARASSPPAAAPVPAIAPMRVVDLGSGGRPNAEPPRTCTRCRGVVDSAAQFCKFCGASLADAAAAPAPVYGAPPAPTTPTNAPPRANGGAVRPPTIPMPEAHGGGGGALDPPTPFASFPAHAHGISSATPVSQAAALLAATPQAQPQQAQQSPYGPPPVQQSPYGPPPAIPPPPAQPTAQAPAPAQAPQAQAPQPAQAPQAPAPQAQQAPAEAKPAARAVIRGRLVVIAKSGADGPSYPIGDTLDVGRSEGQIIVGEDPYLSPRHVRIAWTGSKLVLRDLASTNGVYIRLVAARDMHAGKAGGPGKSAANDEKVPGEVAVPLHDQDLILVGQQVLRFESVSPGSHGEGGFGPATEHSTLLFGSPAAPRYARLSQRTVEGVTRDVYYCRKVETVLGRESGDVVFTEDPFLSRRHAAVRVLDADGAPFRTGAKPTPREGREAFQFALVDLGSSNGSFLKIRNEIDLVPGDHFRVGQQLFRVDIETGARG